MVNAIKPKQDSESCELKSAVAEFCDQASRTEKRLIGWMFVFWIATVMVMLLVLRP